MRSCQPEQPPEQRLSEASSRVCTAGSTQAGRLPLEGRPASAVLPTSELAVTVDVVLTHIEVLSRPELRTWGMDISSPLSRKNLRLNLH